MVCRYRIKTRTMMMTISGKRPLGMAKDTTMTKTNRRLWSSASHRNIYNRIDNEIHSTHFRCALYRIYNKIQLNTLNFR